MGELLVSGRVHPTKIDENVDPKKDYPGLKRKVGFLDRFPTTIWVFPKIGVPPNHPF